MAKDDNGNLSNKELPEALASTIIDVECNTLPFPLTAASTRLSNLPFLALEIKFQASKANNALQDVCESLGHLSFKYITKVCGT